ncbi:MAG: DUF1491 family protein [Pseudomonadota bacterium]
MAEARLASDLWVAAYLARVQAEGIAAYVLHRGDDQAGAIAVKLATCDGQAVLFTRAYDAAGARIWEAREGAEPEIDQAIQRQRGFDPDLWVIEVEDRRGRHLLDQMGLT